MIKFSIFNSREFILLIRIVAFQFFLLVFGLYLPNYDSFVDSLQHLNLWLSQFLSVRSLYVA
jgi:hypothetical protein